MEPAPQKIMENERVEDFEQDSQLFMDDSEEMDIGLKGEFFFCKIFFSCFKFMHVKQFSMCNGRLGNVSYVIINGSLLF